MKKLSILLLLCSFLICNLFAQKQDEKTIKGCVIVTNLGVCTTFTGIYMLYKGHTNSLSNNYEMKDKADYQLSAGRTVIKIGIITAVSALIIENIACLRIKHLNNIRFSVYFNEEVKQFYLKYNF